MHRTSRNEQISARSGPSTGQQGGVDDGRQDGNTSLLDGDDKGRLGGGGSQVERTVRGGDKQADDEGAANVEDDEPEPDALDSLGHRASRVGCLGGGNGRHFGADKGKGGVDHDAEEGEEAAFGAGDAQILHKSPRLAPVSEANGLVVGAAAGADDDARDDQANYCDDLDSRKPKLHFSVCPVTAKVDGVHHDEHEADPHGIVADARGARATRVAGPEGDEHDGGRDFGGEHNDVEEPVYPAHGEAQLGRDVPTCQGKLAAGHGELRDHLAEDDHDREEKRSHDDVAEEETGRATVFEVVGCAEEEACADDTTNGNHLPGFGGRGSAITSRLFWRLIYAIASPG